MLNTDNKVSPEPTQQVRDNEGTTLKACVSMDLEFQRGRLVAVACNKIAHWTAEVPGGQFHYCFKHGLEAQELGVDVALDAQDLVR